MNIPQPEVGYSRYEWHIMNISQSGMRYDDHS